MSPVPQITVCFYFQSPNHFFCCFSFLLKKKKKNKKPKKQKPLWIFHYHSHYPTKEKGVLRVYFLTFFFCLSYVSFNVI